MHEYGIAGLWTQSDWLGRGVAMTLMLMSITSWSVIAVRAWDNWQVRRMAMQARRDFWHARSVVDGLAALSYRPAENPFRQLVIEGEEAVRHHSECRSDLHGTLNISDWVTSNLKRVIDDSAQRMQSGLTLLASIGSTAPFLGLLGTVWGIYHALTAIGIAGQASIDKVAGPVGEALIMTAIGLAVAVPAVLGYNWLIRRNKSAMERVRAFGADLHAVLLSAPKAHGKG